MHPARARGSGLGSDEGVLSEVRGLHPPRGLYNILGLLPGRDRDLASAAIWIPHVKGPARNQLQCLSISGRWLAARKPLNFLFSL